MIILPDSEENETVLSHHLAVAQGTLKIYGIADPLDLSKETQKAS